LELRISGLKTAIKDRRSALKKREVSGEGHAAKLSGRHGRLISMIAGTTAQRQAALMRFQVFFSAAAIIALGMAALRVLERASGMAFLQGALTLGGGLLICGLFSLKMKWHGIIGAGVLALLGAARGFGNLPDLARFLGGERERGPAPVMELGITVVCLVLLVRVLASLQRERIRRMLDE